VFPLSLSHTTSFDIPFQNFKRQAEKRREEKRREER